MGFGLEKLVIGTAQFGQDYGVTNTHGKVSEKEVESILETARTLGIKNLDTAISYGNSENVLGNIGIDDFHVVTKLASFESMTSSFSKFCHDSLQLSLKNLRVPSIDTVLLHRPEELLGSNGKSIYRALLDVKDKGLVENIGISIYSPDILTEIVSKYVIDAIQVPLNIFDRRIISSGWLNRFKDMNVTVTARSVFLQGVLLSNPNNLPAYFQKWSSDFKKMSHFCQINSLSNLEACLQFVTQIPEVDKVIVGVENEKQFSEIISALIAPRKLESNYLESNDLGLINPIDWKL